MKSIFLVFLILICKYSYASTNIDSLLEVVIKKYASYNYLEYDASMKKMDSSRKIILLEKESYFKHKRPEYYVSLVEQVEKMYVNKNFIEINHLDSSIKIALNCKTDSSFNNMNLYLDNFRNMNLKYIIERENSNEIKIKVDFRNIDSNIYMSLLIDKKNLFITQNQMTKMEIYMGEKKLFFYQFDFKNFNTKIQSFQTIQNLTDLLLNDEKRKQSKYRNYIIEYQNQ